MGISRNATYGIYQGKIRLGFTQNLPNFFLIAEYHVLWQ